MRSLATARSPTRPLRVSTVTDSFTYTLSDGQRTLTPLDRRRRTRSTTRRWQRRRSNVVQTGWNIADTTILITDSDVTSETYRGKSAARTVTGALSSGIGLWRPATTVGRWGADPSVHGEFGADRLTATAHAIIHGGPGDERRSTAAVRTTRSTGVVMT